MNCMQAYAETKNILKKNSFYKQSYILVKKVGMCKKKTQKNKNKLALLQSMSNRKK